jgi:hypothetical protein
MRKELHVSSERDMLRSGVEVRSGSRWSWFASDASVCVPGRFYWIFADLALSDSLVYDPMIMDCQTSLVSPVEFISYQDLMTPCFNYLSKMLSSI